MIPSSSLSAYIRQGWLVKVPDELLTFGLGVTATAVLSAAQFEVTATADLLAQPRVPPPARHARPTHLRDLVTTPRYHY